jgi:hypothetical protein
MRRVGPVRLTASPVTVAPFTDGRDNKKVTVIDQDGKTLWSGLASDEATRFGPSYKAENYHEVLSDAVVNTVSSMLQAADFQRAISGPSN